MQFFSEGTKKRGERLTFCPWQLVDRVQMLPLSSHRTGMSKCWHTRGKVSQQSFQMKRGKSEKKRLERKREQKQKQKLLNKTKKNKNFK